MSEPSVLSENSLNLSSGNPSVESLRKILVISSTFPSAVMPTYGVFVKERLKAVAKLPGYELRVISPVPYFPPIRQFKKWYKWSQFPREEIVDGLKVYRPRYFLPPKIGGYFHPRLMYPAAKRAVEKIRAEFDFDLIDAHFFYPSGCVAAKLGEHYQRPVVITGRGEDILRFPELPVIGGRIRTSLRQTTQLIAVSEEIGKKMVSLGADPGKVTVIPNGVDCQKFQPIPMRDARRELNLPIDRPIVISVGYRLELKGFHILVNAIPKIRERFPDVLVVIVGGQASWAADYLPMIEERVRHHNIGEHVIIVGDRPQDELANWYSAADVFALLTSREGSPNVLMEALACGLPAVATPVGGIPEILGDSRLGILLPQRSVAVAAEGIVAALDCNWDRRSIRGVMEGRSWGSTALDVDRVFRRTLDEFPSERN